MAEMALPSDVTGPLDCAPFTRAVSDFKGEGVIGLSCTQCAAQTDWATLRVESRLAQGVFRKCAVLLSTHSYHEEGRAAGYIARKVLRLLGRFCENRGDRLVAPREPATVSVSFQGFRGAGADIERR